MAHPSSIDLDLETLLNLVGELKDENLTLRKTVEVRDKTIDTLCLIVDQLKLQALRLKKSADQVLTHDSSTPILAGTCTPPTTVHTEE
jgi:hypothetical protein